MKILVTGGRGYVGTRLADALKKKGHSVKTLGIEKDSDFVADITDFGKISKAVKGFDAIIHLAALIGVKESREQPTRYFMTNSIGTLNMLEAARMNGIKKMVFASSLTVYGEPEHLPVDENHPLKPLSPYGYSKVVAEDFCRAYSELYGMTIVIARLANLYGPGQSGDLFMPTVLSQLKKEKITIRSLDFKLDYMYIDDVVSALTACLEYGKSDVFNFSAGRSVSGKEIIDALSKIVGRTLVVETTNPKKEKEITLDIRKAKKILDWEPKIGIEEGLRKSIGHNICENELIT